MPFEEYSNNFSNFEFEIVGNTEQKNPYTQQREEPVEKGNPCGGFLTCHFW